MTPLFIANWKMNKLLKEAKDFCEEFNQIFTPLPSGEKDTGIAAPLTAISAVSDALLNTKGIMLGVQNVHWEQSGAHTGEVSIPMVQEQGVEFAILGHSERRQFYGETNEAVAKRASATLNAKLTAIVCIGESQAQFEAKQTESVVKEQLLGSLAGIKPTEKLIIAYEPVWAIGTGLTATPDIAGSIHSFIRTELKSLFGEDQAQKIPLLYGGSAKPDNIAELTALPDVNGALVGGASLDAKTFNQLIQNGR